MKTETELQEKYRRLVDRAEAEAYEADRRGEDYEDWVHDVTSGNSLLKKLAGFLDDAFICDHAFCIKCNFEQMKEHAGFSDDEKKQAEKLVACCKLFLNLERLFWSKLKSSLEKARCDHEHQGKAND